MERIKRVVDRLVDTRFDDIAAINAQLQTSLGAVQTGDGFDVRTSVSGSLGGIPVSDIELRSAKDDASHVTLLLRFPLPGVPLESAPWPNATLYPPRPDAVDSAAYWSVDAAPDTRVILGLSADEKHLIQMTIRKN
ncbi:hypothetical protein [Xanthomonas sacchari]|uniref:hypothetical protein n=1 Tax=Xanthomonas sacchari TaxID=56458 RepID=UPI0035277CBD